MTSKAEIDSGTLLKDINRNQLENWNLTGRPLTPKSIAMQRS